MDTYELVDESHAERLQKSLFQFYESNILCNVVLRSSDGHDIQVHWLVMASASDMFSAQSCSPIIYTGIEISVLAVLVNFIYRGRLSFQPNMKHKLLTACEKLKLRDIKDVIEQGTGVLSQIANNSIPNRTNLIETVPSTPGETSPRKAEMSGSSFHSVTLEEETTAAIEDMVIVQQTFNDMSSFDDSLNIKQEVAEVHDIAKNTYVNLETLIPEDNGASESESRVRRSIRKRKVGVVRSDDVVNGHADVGSDIIYNAACKYDSEDYTSPKAKIQKSAYYDRIRNYDTSSLLKAYNEVKNGQGTVAAIARKYGIPDRTLRSRITGEISISSLTIGPVTTLSETDESSLIQTLRMYSDLGYRYTQKSITDFASEYAVYTGKKIKGSSFSLKWIRNFSKRWPEVRHWKLWRPKLVGYSTQKTVDDYLLNLHNQLIDHDLLDKPERIYNIQEKCLRIDQQIPILFSESETHQIIVTDGETEATVTSILGGGNAAGSLLPPYFIFSDNFKATLMPGASQGADVTVSRHGHSNPKVFKQFIQDHLIKFLPVHSRADPVLLLYECKRFPFSIPLSDWAEDRGIVLCFLPAYTSHFLHPVHVGCSDDFQKSLDAMCKDDQAVTPSQYNFLDFACKAYTASVTESNLQNGFLKTGVYPFSRDAIDMSDIHKPQKRPEPLRRYKTKKVKKELTFKKE